MNKEVNHCFVKHVAGFYMAEFVADDGHELLFFQEINEFLNDPVKLRAAFAEDPSDTSFQITGPDPGRGNVVAGATLGASTDTWSMGVNFDWVRGDNGSTTEVGTFNLLGRI